MPFTAIHRPLISALVCAGALALAAPGALAQVDHSSHGGATGAETSDAGKSGGKSGGMSGSKGMKKGGGHGGKPGQVMQMCHDMGSMPPHYCEPSYKVMTSVRGVSISDVSPMGDTAVMVTLKAAGGSMHTISQRLVIVGGSGGLAGAKSVAGGWSDQTVVHLNLQGSGTLYDQKSMNLHIFPLTGD